VSGALTVVGTPIGNLGDISPRAVESLVGADIIYCEDTRRTRKLLSALGVPAPRLVRLDQHNEAVLAGQVVAAVRSGRSTVLVSDAGMPAISDPGSRIVQALADAALPVRVVPGPSAVSAALAVSGLPAGRYWFAGFLPRKGPERAVRLTELAGSGMTAVLYEAPHRVARTVADLAETCGPSRPFVAARELTKLHEEVWRGTLGEALSWLASAAGPRRGEWVLLIGPPPAPHAAPGDLYENDQERIAAALLAKLAAGTDRRQAVAGVAAEMDLPKRRVYAVAVSLRDR
jgi:16S rRNA (cytidine1402-2'-O)-methyltransferase